MFNGESSLMVYKYAAENTAFLFDFSKKNASCLRSVMNKFPVGPQVADSVRRGVFCSYVVDNGVEVKSHVYQCLVHVQAGSSFLTVMADIPDLQKERLNPFIADAKDAVRIGFAAMGNEPFWYDAAGLRGQLEGGYSYCGMPLP